MDFADFYAAFALTLQYRASFEEYGRADFLADFLVAVFVGANVRAIIDCCEEVLRIKGP